ncbi:hypothetical protein [Micromonospora zhanjiangensis]|uniref:Uncharacterized protein n=1 Tax=Micromonospora zhanjiangensis TaxID=1522057 RepID=A0ABV8KQ59_9ACTN
MTQELILAEPATPEASPPPPRPWTRAALILTALTIGSVGVGIYGDLTGHAALVRAAWIGLAVFGAALFLVLFGADREAS